MFLGMVRCQELRGKSLQKRTLLSDRQIPQQVKCLLLNRESTSLSSASSKKPSALAHGSGAGRWGQLSPRDCPASDLLRTDKPQVSENKADDPQGTK